MNQNRFPKSLSLDTFYIQALVEENKILREEIRVSREAAEITANLVVKQFEETEKLLHRFQVANAQRKAVLNSASQVSIIATSILGIITVFNTGAENLLGYQADEVIGKETPEKFHLESEVASRCKKITDTGGKINDPNDLFEYVLHVQTEQSEWTYIKKDGTKLTVSMSINTLRERDGSIGGFLFIANDVTEKKLSGHALRESEQKYRLLINNLPNIIYRGYADGSLDFIDNKIEALTGYSRGDFLYRKVKWHDIIVSEDMDGAVESFKKALKTDKSYIREYRIKAKNGDTIWIEEGGQIVCDEDGKIDFITGAFLDISERKLAEKALYESEDKYRSLFDSGPNPVFVVDRKTLKVIDANPCAEETYGYKKSELKDKPFYEFGTAEGEKPNLNIFQDPSEPRVIVNNQKVRQYTKDQKPFFINFNTCPTIYKGREAIILAATDITEMMEKDAHLIQASKMKTLGEMSAGVAHELNQPLNTIKIGNEFINMLINNGREIPTDKLKQVVDEVINQVGRASDIITRLRVFGRKTDFEKEAVDINNTITGVLRIIEKQLSLENITVSLSLDETIPLIIGHNNRLEQVLFNLITNARDAINQKETSDSKPGLRKIQIKSFEVNNRVTVSVSDTGIGMSQETLTKIFDPFFTTKEVGKGMGLGLSIIYGIIKDYVGEIEVKSKEGKGTAIKFSFPKI
jgi:PAS domain S-box-containing protein